MKMLIFVVMKEFKTFYLTELCYFLVEIVLEGQTNTYQETLQQFLVILQVKVFS